MISDDDKGIPQGTAFQNVIQNVNEDGALSYTRARILSLFGATASGRTFKPVILGDKFGDIDSDTDYSDMPHLEESTKKNKEDSEEDSEEDN